MASKTTPLHESLELIGRLADAAGTGHTRAAIARRLADALAGSVPLLELTLGRVEGVAPRSGDVVVWRREDPDDPDSGLVDEHTAPLTGTAAATILATGDTTDAARAQSAVAVATFSAHDEPWPALRDVRHAFDDLGASRFVVMRLSELDASTRAYATFALGDDPDDARHLATLDALDAPVVLDAIARVLAVALRNASLIERVATLSRRAHRENQQLRQQLQQLETPERLVARSPGMRAVLARVELVADHPTTVLLRGESGTGKELLARRIHRLSPRSGRALLKVNCGAIPLELVESELFGHEKGAFTGAIGRHAGLFERADGGTLFLDEIGELPLSAQVKLLRVLQEGTFERVGGEQALSVDVRVIAATHRDLETMVERGDFRADLYYRLNVFPIEVPALRQRTEDLHGLVEVLLAAIGRRLGRAPLPRLTREVLARLREHTWPGNVRELENVLERAVIVSPGDTLRLSSELVTRQAPRTPAAMPSSLNPTHTPETTVQPLDEAIRAAIERALHASGGRIYGEGGAAELLGLKPTTLQSKMKKLGVQK